jgi:transcriptional regulator
VGFELSIREVNANYKLSQNKKDNDYYSVIAHLRALGDENSLRVAAEMEARRPAEKQPGNFDGDQHKKGYL